jgi:hypothetical protein
MHQKPQSWWDGGALGHETAAWPGTSIFSQPAQTYWTFSLCPAQCQRPWGIGQALKTREAFLDGVNHAPMRRVSKPRAHWGPGRKEESAPLDFRRTFREDLLLQRGGIHSRHEGKSRIWLSSKTFPARKLPRQGHRGKEGSQNIQQVGGVCWEKIWKVQLECTAGDHRPKASDLGY